VIEKLKTQKPATVRLQVAECLKAMRLARKQGRLATVPEVDLPTVNNTRTGFFEEDQYRAVLEALKGRADLQAAIMRRAAAGIVQIAPSNQRSRRQAFPTAFSMIYAGRPYATSTASGSVGMSR
jgi:hypothetical protein